ncbi:helix-turn-helix DNA binding domain protein [Arthrobacter phage Hirko]|nr:helix-turn-helix DNA binding domain protein [Arthrobacter phage Hirko]
MTETQAAGRSYQRGSDRPAAKLTDPQIVEIRQAYAHGARQRELAEQYGVTQGLVSGIVNGRRWRHADGPLPLTTEQEK